MTVAEEYAAWNHMAHLLHAARSSGWNDRAQDDAERLVAEKKIDLEALMAEGDRKRRL